MPATTLHLRYRHVDLGDAVLHDDGDRHFLVLELPPPVRTILVADDRTYEVESVVETETGPGNARGCYVRPADRSVSAAVGSESLASGSANVEPAPGDAVTPVGADDDLDYGARMAVPAPVVDTDGSDSSEPIDVSGQEVEDASGSEPIDVAADTAASKKRRGRKRR